MFVTMITKIVKMVVVSIIFICLSFVTVQKRSKGLVIPTDILMKMLEENSVLQCFKVFRLSTFSFLIQ